MYITEGDLEKFILQDIDATYSPWIDTIIGFVEAYIDKYCDTTYSGTGIASDRFYDGSDSDVLIIDNYTEISAVQFLDDFGNVIHTVPSNGWNTAPYNGSVYNQIQLNGNAGYAYFPAGNRTVKVTGKFGYTDVPPPVKYAGIQLATKIINEGLRGGQVSSENLGSYSVSYQKVDEVADSMGIKDILNMYRRVGME